MEDRLTHIDENGRPRMVDVGEKADTKRLAVAKGSIYMHPETLKRVREEIHRQRRCSLCGADCGHHGGKKSSLQYSDVPQYFYHRRRYEF